MAKRFTVVDLGDKQVVKSGYVEPDSLHNIQEVIELLSNTLECDKVEVVVYHLIFRDIPDAPITDVTTRELSIIEESFPDLVDADFIGEEEVISLVVRGIKKVSTDDLEEAGDI